MKRNRKISFEQCNSDFLANILKQCYRNLLGARRQISIVFQQWTDVLFRQPIVGSSFLKIIAFLSPTYHTVVEYTLLNRRRFSVYMEIKTLRNIEDFCYTNFLNLSFVQESLQGQILQKYLQTQLWNLPRIIFGPFRK